MNYEVAVERLRRRVSPLYVTGDMKAMRRTFVHLAASVALDTDEMAIYSLADELKDQLMVYSRRVQRGLFDDL